MHYSRISAAPTAQYSAATAVLMNELLKGSISLGIALVRIDGELTLAEADGAGDRKADYAALSPASMYASDKEQLVTGSLDGRLPKSFLPSLTATSAGVRSLLARKWTARLAQLRSEVFSPDCWKLSIPAILYVIQNNLQYVAASNLDVATFQVTYQMKILTTAGFSVALLGKRLTPYKWFALGCLALGVGIVQIQGSSAASGGHAGLIPGEMNAFRGFVAVTAACFTSGLAGVYFEKVLKGSQADLWIRNVQLSLFSLIPAILPVLLAPATTSTIRDSGPLVFLAAPFAHFHFWAWATVSIQVFGGLVTAVVIRYADNILKGFATSISIVISFLVSVGFFGYSITPAFVIGSSTVLGATWMYNQRRAPLNLKSWLRLDGSESHALGSPAPPDAPILGDLRRPTQTSLLTNLMSLLASSLTPKAATAVTLGQQRAHSTSSEAVSSTRHLSFDR